MADRWGSLASLLTPPTPSYRPPLEASSTSTSSPLLGTLTALWLDLVAIVKIKPIQGEDRSKTRAYRTLEPNSGISSDFTSHGAQNKDKEPKCLDYFAAGWFCG